jgi:hypothetical protein
MHIDIYMFSSLCFVYIGMILAIVSISMYIKDEKRFKSPNLYDVSVDIGSHVYTIYVYAVSKDSAYKAARIKWLRDKRAKNMRSKHSAMCLNSKKVTIKEIK